MSWDNEHNLIDADSVIEEAMISASKSWCPDSQSHLFIMIFKALLRMGKIRAAKQAADMAFVADCEDDSPYSRAGSLGATTLAFAQCGDMEAAKRAADEAFAAARQEQGSQSVALIKAIAALIVVGKISEAITAARMIREPMNQSQAFASIAEAMVKLEDRDQAEAIINEGLVAARNIVYPEVRCSSAVGFFIALTEIGKGGEAKREFDEMHGVAREIEQPHPRAWELFRLFDALVQVGKLDEATVILDEIVSLVREVENVDVMPQNYAAVAEAKARLGKEGEAKRLLTEGCAALRKTPDINFKGQALVDFSKVMIRFGMIHEASNILDEALSSARNFKETDADIGDYRSRISIEVVSVLAGIGEIEYALTITDDLVSPDSKIAAFMIIATAMSSDAGRIEEAKRLIDETLALVRKTGEPMILCHPSRGYQCRMLTSIAEILVKIGKKAEARTVALEALVGARSMDNSEDQAPALIAVAEVLDKCFDEEIK